MIGNDIVDLNFGETRTRWKRKGFLQKIFTEKELQLIKKSANKDLLVWRLWSMKEAAYKAHQRELNFAPKFNPKSLECNLFSEEKGIVESSSKKYSCITKMNENFIYSEAVIEKAKVYQISGVQENISSKKLKELIFPQLQKKLAYTPSSQLKVMKCKHQIPHLYIGGSAVNIPVTFTHHGIYAAYFIAFPW